MKKEKQKKTVIFKRQKYRVDDFSLAKLPDNRFKQFFDIFKIEWKTLLLLGCILLLFSLVFIVLEVLHTFVASNLPSQLRADGGTEEQIINAQRLVEIIYNAILIPVFMIISVGLSGIARVLQRMVYGEGILLKDDFLHGIKINFKQYLILSLIYGVIRWIVVFNFYYIGTVMALGEIVQGTSMGVFYLLIVPILLFMFAQSIIYDIKIWTNFKNSSKIAIASFFPMLIFGGILLGLFFLNFIWDPFIKMGIEIAIILLIAPIYLLSLLLYSVSRFDLFINRDNYPQAYRKGLRPDIVQMEEINNGHLHKKDD